jgi:hypothetical protein
MHEGSAIRCQVHRARAQHLRHGSGAALHSQLYCDYHAALQRIPEHEPGSQLASYRRLGVRQLHRRLRSRLPESRLAPGVRNELRMTASEVAADSRGVGVSLIREVPERGFCYYRREETISDAEAG